jgi:SEL1 protein
LRTASLGFEEPWTARKKEKVREEEEEEMMGPSLQRDLRSVMRFMVLLVVFVLLPVVSATKNFVILLEDDDSREPVDSVSKSVEELEGASEEKKMGRMGFASDAEEPVVEWDEFGDSEDKTDDDLDPGSWKQMLENPESSRQGNEYAMGVRKMFEGIISEGEPVMLLKEAIRHFQADADHGNAHSQSTLAFLLATGVGVQQSDSKAFLYHHFAAKGGNFQSKMALAYTYSRQQMHEEAVKLYAELAATAMASFISSKDAPLMEPVQLNVGFEESRETLKKFRGEDDDDFQFLEYQAHKGYTEAMYRLGVFYYFGLRGVHRDHSKALTWLLKAVEKSDPRSMELLGEIYARGYGVERNYSRAYEWFLEAARKKHYSALNGIGYLYVKGEGVADGKNHTMAKEYFRRAAEAGDSHGHYNLGVLYLEGMGVKKDVKEACKLFLIAANKGHPKAFYQLAKMQQTGIPGMKKDIATVSK